MGILDELQEEMKLLDKAAEHDGYWYSVSRLTLSSQRNQG